jgi:hypothetical protein
VKRVSRAGLGKEGVDAVKSVEVHSLLLVELNAKLNAELTVESNARARAHKVRKCHCYGLKRDASTTTIITINNRSEEIMTDLRAFNRPCVAHQICDREDIT